jgi:hypothetical protein
MSQTENSVNARILLSGAALGPAPEKKNNLFFVLGVVTLLGTAMAQDPGWPRLHTQQGAKLLIYQPQVDDWQNFQEITGRMAFTMTPTGGKEVVGAANFEAGTDVDTINRTVLFHDIQFTKIYFPSMPSGSVPAMESMFRAFVPATVSISLDRVAACVKKPESVPTVALNNDPPRIFVSYNPAILLEVNGEPVLADVPATHLKYVVNTTWHLFLETSKSEYFLVAGPQWLTAKDPKGPWSATKKLPKDMEKLPEEAQWADLKNSIPPPQNSAVIPGVFYSTTPAEIILFDGNPVYAKIPNTRLAYATNTDSPVFFHGATAQYYYLTAGRWFRSADLSKWSFASLDLPPDFQQIPPDSPAGAIRASVPGTDEAKDAVLIAQIPTTMVVDPVAAAAQVKVVYTGAPAFKPITGTSLLYATNTPDKVIQVGTSYYLCLQGVWFVSGTAEGPWTTAPSVPQEIYTIPASSPVYNVTYVTQVTTASGSIESSYTGGYMGAFVMGAAVGAIVASGTGYYYPPYIGYPIAGYPVYHPYPMPYGSSAYYNSRTGAYGVSQTAYGAYGSATRTASYNPYTGTATRTASASTAYGSQMVGQAYNPYTGSYAATHQGSSPTAQWGSSVATKGNQTVTAQHYSTAQGTTGSIQSSSGAKAAGTTVGPGNTAVGKSSSGDLYASHDGNVYKNTGNGWQSYNNGSWNSTNKPTQPTTAANEQAAQQRAQGTEQQRPTGSSSAAGQSASRAGGSPNQEMEQERQNRQRGESQSSHAGGSAGGFGGGGRSFGGGGARAGGRRR